jgi:hypothetical protein
MRYCWRQPLSNHRDRAIKKVPIELHVGSAVGQSGDSNAGEIAGAGHRASCGTSHIAQSPGSIEGRVPVASVEGLLTSAAGMSIE